MSKVSVKSISTTDISFYFRQRIIVRVAIRHAPKLNNRISLFQTYLIVYELYERIVALLV